MAEAPKAKTAKPVAVPFDAAKEQAKFAAAAASFEFPKFDLPSMEVPAAYRELAEKSIAQAKQSYERMKVAAEEATDVLEATYATATKGASDYGLKVLEAFRANANANFDFARDLLTVKSLSEAIELSSAHTRNQFEAVTTQTKDLAALAQKVTTEAVEPVKSGFSKAFRAVA
jgi:phasin